MEHVYSSAIGNCKILDHCSNWATVQYLEAYFIKTKPVIDVGLKVLKNFNFLNMIDRFFFSYLND